MAKSIYHKADSRGSSDLGWLKSNFSFSFAQYYNPERMHFGVLRVLNDDIVAAGMGFGMHPHDNMEIITIPLEGDLAHKDTMGNATIIKHGDVQVMSAGSGIQHSEFNPNKDKPVKLLQIWIYPNKKNVTPRYDQITLDVTKRQNKLQQILSPLKDDEGVWIYQDAWFHLGKFDKDLQAEYEIIKEGNGVYLFVIEGEFAVMDQILSTRDAFGIWETNSITLQAKTQGAEILLMELPMSVNA
jgi:hypothetical protein